MGGSLARSISCSPDQVTRQLLAMQNGSPVYVSDVATVSEGFKKPDGVVRRFGEK